MELAKLRPETVVWVCENGDGVLVVANTFWCMSLSTMLVPWLRRRGAERMFVLSKLDTVNGWTAAKKAMEMRNCWKMRVQEGFSPEN